MTVGKSEPLIVVYNDPSKRKKLKKSQATQNSSFQVEDNFPEPEEFNLIKTKHEVKKFTIKALKKTSKNQAQIALAVSLGAKPPKAICQSTMQEKGRQGDSNKLNTYLPLSYNYQTKRRVLGRIEIKWLILMLVLENLVQNFKNKLRMQKNLKNDLMRIQCLFVIFSRPGKLFP